MNRFNLLRKALGLGMNKKKIALIVSLVASLASGAGLLARVYSKSKLINDCIEIKKAELLKKTIEASKEVDNLLAGYQEKVAELAKCISSGYCNYADSVDQMADVLKNNKIVFSVAIAYEPFQFSDEDRLFATAIVRTDTVFEKKQVEDLYDYTDKNEKRAEWYSSTIKNGAQWINPFYGSASNNLIFSYAVPFFKKSKEQRQITTGVLIFNFSVDELSDYLKSIDLGPSGYGAIISQTGRYIVHPEDKYIIDGQTLLEIGTEKNDEERLKWWSIRHDQSYGVWDHMSTTTGKESFFIFAPMFKTKFSIHNTFLKKDVILEYDLIRKISISNIAYWLLFILCITSVFLISRGGSHLNLWGSTFSLSMILIVSIGYTWHIALKFHSKRKLASQYIVNESTRRINENSLVGQYRKYGDLEIHKIPTGVYIDEIKFDGINNVILVGTIWQKFTHKKHENTPKNIVFPSAELLEGLDPKISRHFDYDLYRWDFKVSINQKFEYMAYPLNYEKIHLKIQQEESYLKVIPTPDINAYKLTTPTSKLGLRKGISIPGWGITESSFSIHTESLDADFGNGTILANNFFPTLNFNIGIKRKFLDVFISNLTPLILVLSLLFLGLMISNVSEKYFKLFKPDLPKMIGFYSGLLFVVAFAHIGIRSKVNAEGLFLLEYFYLIAYAAFMYVTISTILYRAQVTRGFIHYRNNIIYKISFWPLILAGILGISIAMFY